MKVGSRFSITKLKNFSQGKRYSWIFTKQNILIQNCLFCMKNVICIVIKKAALRAEFSDGNEFCQKKKKPVIFNQVHPHQPRLPSHMSWSSHPAAHCTPCPRTPHAVHSMGRALLAAQANWGTSSLHPACCQKAR